MTRQRPVWGYFAVALLCLVGGLGFLWSSFEWSMPRESVLTRVQGEIATIRIVDDLSGQPIGLNTPLNSIHFTLKGNPTVFRYPSGWPGYTDLYERLAFTVDIWVDPAELDGQEPVLVYALKQTTPAHWAYPAVSVNYDAIREAQETGKRSYRLPGFVLLMLAPVVFLFGYLIVLSNRRNQCKPRAR